MAEARTTARRALFDGLRAAALLYGTGTLVLAWATIGLTGMSMGEGVVVALGCLVTLAGGLCFLLPTPRSLTLPRIAAAVVLETAGYVTALVALAAAALPPAGTASFPLSPMKTAMLAFTVTAGRRRAPLATAAGLVVVTEAVSTIVGPRVGLPWAFDLPEAVTLALIAVGSLGLLIAGRRTAGPRRIAMEAVDVDTLTRTRAIARSHAAAVVHDTVLGDLAALAIASPGALSDSAAARLHRTLDVVASPDWSVPEPTVQVRGGAIFAAVAAAEAEGMAVQVQGEFAALVGLETAVERALAAAVEQCLVNTRTHAGTLHAEITVMHEDAALTVMVSDSGVGFDTTAVRPGRLGLETSIRGRVAEVGGTVLVFAQPGVGTTVLLTVPLTVVPEARP